MVLTQVTLKIYFPDRLCQGILPEVSQISAQLLHRDQSNGIWTALPGECIVEDSTEQPGAGLRALSLSPGVLWQAAWRLQSRLETQPWPFPAPGPEKQYHGLLKLLPSEMGCGKSPSPATLTAKPT